MPTVPNYVSGVGQLTTNRYDFQKHLDGYTTFRHTDDEIDLASSPQTINSVVCNTVNDALITISGTFYNPSNPVPKANSYNTAPHNYGFGTITFAQGGDLAQGSATGIAKVIGIQGVPIDSALTPLSGDLLSYDGSKWTNLASTAINISTNFGSKTISTTGTVNAGTLVAGVTTITGAMTIPIHNISGGLDENGCYWCASNDFIVGVTSYSMPALTEVVLPAVSSGRVIILKDVNYYAASHNIIIATYEWERGGETGNVNKINNIWNYFTMNANGESVMLISDGTNWHTLAFF
jgi:hypothetical protein